MNDSYDDRRVLSARGGQYPAFNVDISPSEFEIVLPEGGIVEDRRGALTVIYHGTKELPLKFNNGRIDLTSVDGLTPDSAIPRVAFQALVNRRSGDTWFWVVLVNGVFLACVAVILYRRRSRMTT